MTERPPAGHSLPRPLTMLRAQAATELRLTLRRGESVLVTVLLPALLLVFFSTVPLLPNAPAAPAAPSPGSIPPVQLVFPAVLALAVMSTAMVSLGIATAFERQYGVLKRLGGTPLSRPALLGAKALAVLAVEGLQLVLLTAIALLLGWRPPPAGAPPVVLVPLALLLGTAAFGGLGLWMAGSWRAEAVLAGANGLYLVLLLLGGILVPPEALPGPLGPLATLLPSGALASVLRGALAPGPGPSYPALLVLTLWALATPLLAARTFRWE
ncbi:MAG TPA: ABC transporter permease [Chloroflexota bacterium]|nr:ABC transporter permease [Chloroflexota bacterium]